MKKKIAGLMFAAILSLLNVHDGKCDYVYNGHLYKDVAWEDFVNVTAEIVENEVIAEREGKETPKNAD